MNNMGTAKFKTKNLLPETLEALPVGGKIRIFYYEFKSEQVRWAASMLLKRKGMKFTVSGKDAKDSVTVTRLS